METNYRLQLQLREIKKDIISFLVAITLAYTLGMFTGLFAVKQYIDKHQIEQVETVEKSDIDTDTTYYIK